MSAMRLCRSLYLLLVSKHAAGHGLCWQCACMHHGLCANNWQMGHAQHGSGLPVKAWLQGACHGCWRLIGMPDSCSSCSQADLLQLTMIEPIAGL